MAQIWWIFCSPWPIDKTDLSEGGKNFLEHLPKYYQ
jgi:hypothetical protein